MRVSVTWHNNNPNTIWNLLARKLGREPTNSEAAAEIERIQSEVMVEMASAGRLLHQIGRSSV